jgi:non-specific serine/threonine protein kinase
MALVWLARLPGVRSIAECVALKTMLPALRADPRFEQMFLAEARTAARIKHPNVGEVLEVGEDGGVLYLVMEWIQGESLATLAKHAGPSVPYGVATRIVLDVARGLHAAHSLQDDEGPAPVVHRDVSPQNVMVRDDGVAKIVDFGVSKAASDDGLTQSGYTKGKVAYMSPEQAFGERVDARTDVFALGVVLYEATLGRHPFRGATQIVTLSNVATADAVAPNEIAADYPHALAAVVSKALQKEREERYATMQEFVDALEDAAQSLERATRADVAALVAQTAWASGGKRREEAAARALRDDGSAHSGVDPRRDQVAETGAGLHDWPSGTWDLVGRSQLVALVLDHVRRERLVTLTGPAGTGKTRLATHAAAKLVRDYEDGVFFVSLAPVRDAAEVLPAIARSLAVAESREVSTVSAIAAHVADRRVLVVLDNFEHVLAAAPAVGELLAAAPGLTMLATSQAVLHVNGERLVEVPPLELPSLDGPIDLEAFAHVAAVAMFARAARGHDPTFTVTAQNCEVIGRIVQRLDGLPLAIELAAARLRTLPPKHLLERLDQRFRVLRGAAPELPARQRTLRDAVAWSYDLLTEPERALFVRAGVFVGGFTLDAADAVADGEPVEDVEVTLASLVDKSLVRRRGTGATARYVMLETLRDFALAALEPDDARVYRRRHAMHLASVAEQAEPAVKERDGAVLSLLSVEEGNLRAALRFCIDAQEVELGLRIASAVWRYWHATGRMMEGRRWLDELLARDGGSRVARAKGYVAIAGLAYWQGDYAVALERYGEALEVFRSIGDKLGVADTLFAMSTTSTWNGDRSAGKRLAAEARALFEEFGARKQVGETLMAQGFATWMDGDLQGARPLWEESLAIAMECGDAVEASSKSLALAALSFQQDERPEALARALSAMDDLHALENVAHTVMAVDFVAAIAAATHPEDAVRLAGASAALRGAQGGGMRPEACGLESARSSAARAVDGARIALLWREGQSLTLEEAVTIARSLRTKASVPVTRGEMT